MCPEVADIFRTLEKSKRGYLRTLGAEARVAHPGPHLVRLPSGAVPEYIHLTSLQAFAWRMLGDRARRLGAPEKLEDDLLKAHMKIRPEEYVAYVWVATILAGILGAVLAIALVVIPFVFFPGLDNLTQLLLIAVAVALVVLSPLGAYGILMSTASSKAKRRGRNIDQRISPAMSFISAMASADVNVDVIFKELSRQPVYGEIKNESEWITRDTELLGNDILSAIRRAATRSPSVKWQDFLQGVITTSTSGGQLKPYFLLKAEQFEKENKLAMKAQMETLGLLAESFVTVVVAFPLFLVVIIAIFAIVNWNPTIIPLLYMVVLLMIPLSQFGFIFVIWNMSKEAAV